MNLVPAFVDSWDGKTMRVFITGYTDGADIGMKAEVLFPFSDRPDYTGFHIEKGDPVWVVFNNGDPNQPIVIGYRNFQTGKNKNSRRWRHQNIETHATERCLNTSKNHDIEVVEQFHTTAQTIKLTGHVIIEGNVDISGNTTVSGTSNAADHISNGISGKSHTHTGVHGETTPPH